MSLTVPDVNRNDILYFRVFTTDAGIGVATVQDPLFGLWSAQRPRFTLPNSQTVTFGTFDVNSEGKNAYFLVFDAAVEGYLIARDVLQRTPPPVTVQYPGGSLLSVILNPYDTDAHYANREITLGILYGSSPDVVLHEYGHFLADVNGFNAPGGQHFFPFRSAYQSKLGLGRRLGLNVCGGGTERARKACQE